MRPTFKTLGKLWLGLVLAGLLAACQEGEVPATRRQVALVAKSTETEFWRSVFAGAEAAAAEYNLELSIAGPETEEDYAAQNEMVQEAVAQGAEAIVFSAIDYENNAGAIEEAIRAGVRVVAIDSSVNADGVSAYIGTDNYAAGRQAAQAALDAMAEDVKVGIVNFDVNSANGQERERGAREAFEESGRAEIVSVINTLAEAEDACEGAVAMLQDHPEINALLAFNEPTTVGAAQAVEQLGRTEEIWLVGFDSNVASVDAMQTGAVDALVVQNPYAMGYLGVESAYRLLAGQKADVPVLQDTETSTVTRETMFTLDSQKVLFAFE